MLGAESHKQDNLVKVDYFLKLKTEKFDFFDPYQAHKKVKVDAVKLEDLFLYFAPKAKSVKFKAINLYKVHILREVERSKSTYLMFKQDGQWLKNAQLGPMRVIRRGLGKVSKKDITLEGADWIWMITEMQFIYE